MSKPKRIELNIVRLSADLAARVDAWAAGQAVDRSGAIQRLIELALAPESATGGTAVHGPRDEVALEALAMQQVGLLIDPETPEEERARRIQRLTEGPPEFVDIRIDLPRRRAH